MAKYSFLAVDLQNDFATFGGKFYTPKPCTRFLLDTFFPFLTEKEIKVNEIVSDYRQPRPGDRGDCCHPGEWGYESVVPSYLRKSLWVKSMNSPVWIRENIGDSSKAPGLPYPDSQKFYDWVLKNIGRQGEVTPVVFGLTIDCCALSTVQELSWRGYYPLVLREGVDHATGKIPDRDRLLESPVSNWADVVGWEDLKRKLG